MDRRVLSLFLQRMRSPPTSRHTLRYPQGLVSEQFAARNIKIVSEGSIAAETIDSNKLIDQHYYAIASKATILPPSELNVPSDKFEKQVRA